MRFEASVVHRIRRGDINATVRRHTGRPCSYRVGGRYRLRRVDDVRSVDYGTLSEGGEPVVTYERQVVTLDDRIEITRRETALLEALPDEVVRATGHEDRGDLIDCFRADFGGPLEQRVWVLWFCIDNDPTEFMARQQGIANAGQYVTSADRAIDDAPVVDPATLSGYVAQNRKHDELREQKRRALYELRSEAARLAEIEPLVADLGLGRQMARVRDAIRALEKEQKRRAA